MTRKAISLILFFCLLLSRGKAQNIIRGSVTDSMGNFLQNITVSVIDANTKAVVGYYITASNGKFEIQVSSINNVLLRVSSIGYKMVEKSIIETELFYPIILYTSINALPEVVVKTQNLVTGKGDTLNYNVQQFIKPQDRTIGDVIKNLPGITISPTGTISYNGKAINKFYIDGDDILGDKYVLGTKTLPADVVTTVQVLENHQPIKMLENRVFSESAALNIKLTSSAKLRVFGSGHIAGGFPVSSVDGRVNTLSFKKKLKFINTYAYNSVGENLGNEVRTQNTSLPWQAMNGNTLGQLVNFTRLPDPILPNRYFTNNNTHLGSLNGLIPVSKEGSLRFNLSWLPERNRYDTKNTNVFYLQADTITQFENQISTVTNNSLLFDATYLLNAKDKYIQNKLLLERGNLNGSSAIENERNQFTQNLKNSATRIENMFSVKKILSNETFFELTSNLKYAKSPQNLNIAFGLYPWLLNNNISFNQTSQFVNQQLFSHNIEGSLSKKIKHTTASLRAEHLAERTNYTSWLNLLQRNNETKKADSVFQNQLTFLQQRLTLTPSLEYNKKKWRLIIAMPLLLRQLSYDNKIIGFDTAASLLSLHPSVRLHRELNKFAKLMLSVRRETDFTSPEILLTGALLSNYRNIAQNTQNLQFTNSETFALNYSYRNPLKIKFFNSGLIYSRNLSPFISSQVFNNGLIQNSQQLFQNSTKRLMLISNYSKYIFPLKTTVKLSHNTSLLEYFQVQNGDINHLQNTTNSTTLTIITKPRWYFNSELNINYLTVQSKSKSQKTAIGEPIKIINTTFISTVNFNESTFLQVETNYLYQKTSNRNEVFLTDLKLNHTIKQTKTDIGIKAINIFNQNRFIISSIDGLQVSKNDYWLRPFTLLFTASFRF